MIEPTTPTPDSFAARLKAARLAAGLSQNKLAALVRVSSPTIASWEHERTTPSPQKQGAVLRKLREAGTPQARAQRIISGEDKGPFISEVSMSPPDHDPHNPVQLENAPVSHPANQPVGLAEAAAVTTAYAKMQPLPDIPVGNTHTTPEGVILRRLPDTDDRDGYEVLDGRRYFTVGFVPPHPRAKAPKVYRDPATRELTPADLAPDPTKAQRSTLKPSGPSTPTPPSPTPQIPAEAPPGPPPGHRTRDWAWWNA